MKRCFVFDIDGTLADNDHRLHHIQKEPRDWDAFFADCVNDPPIWHMLKVARELSIYTAIVLITGRSDSVKAQTKTWLYRHLGDYDALYMRPANDHQDDDKLKIEMLSQIRADGWEPIMAFDDRTRVVKAWRAAGVPCAQVADGDF